ncbi:MAG: hypothetical protein ACRCVN_07480 [Spirochaetia bacterium]
MEIQKAFRLDTKLSDLIQQVANEEERSWNAQAIYLLKTHPLLKDRLEKEEKKQD